MLLKVKDLTGFKLEGSDGDIGTVKDFYFDDRKWVVRYLVVETGTWLLSRKVLISPYSMIEAVQADRGLRVNLTKSQIEGSPSWDVHKPLSRQHEVDYSEYYGFPYYWSGTNTWGEYPFMWGAAPYSLPNKDSGAAAAAEKASWDPHLRSVSEVKGYHVHATEGEIGHIEDFILDDKTWAVRYLIVNTSNWWPGKRVLLEPEQIVEVNWSSSIAVVELTRAAVKASPEYDDSSVAVSH